MWAVGQRITARARLGSPGSSAPWDRTLSGIWGSPEPPRWKIIRFEYKFLSASYTSSVLSALISVTLRS